MKTGIKTVLFAITLACSGFTAQAFAAPTPEKVQSTAKTAAAKTVRCGEGQCFHETRAESWQQGQHQYRQR